MVFDGLWAFPGPSSRMQNLAVPGQRSRPPGAAKGIFENLGRNGLVVLHCFLRLDFSSFLPLISPLSVSSLPSTGFLLHTLFF